MTVLTVTLTVPDLHIDIITKLCHSKLKQFLLDFFLKILMLHHFVVVVSVSMCTVYDSVNFSIIQSWLLLLLTVRLNNNTDSSTVLYSVNSTRVTISSIKFCVAGLQCLIHQAFV